MTIRMLTLAALLTLLSGCAYFENQSDRSFQTVAGTGMRALDPVQQQHLEDGQRAVEDGEYQLALALFRDILSENPTVTGAYIGIGDVYLAQERFDRAEPAFRRAARLEPSNFSAQYGHGISLQMLERFVEATRAFLRALEINPFSPKANLNLAMCYLRLDQPGSARQYAEKAVELDPESGAAHVNLGAIYEQLGENNKAIDEYVTALEYLDNPPEVIVNLINVLAREKRYQEAVNTALQLIRIDPSANAYERLGWAYFRLGRYDKSAEAYINAVDFDPQHWPSHNGIGVNAINTWLLSGKTDANSRSEAGNAFRRSLQINPQQPRVIDLMLNYSL